MATRFLVRKVQPGWWDALRSNAVPADLVTKKGCPELRTTDNALSFWRMDGVDERQLRDIALAMAVNFESLDPVNLAWIASSELDGIASVRDTPGATLVNDMQLAHANAEELDLVRLGHLAAKLAIVVREVRDVMLFTAADVKQILVEGHRAKRYPLSNTKAKLQQEIRAALVP